LGARGSLRRYEAANGGQRAGNDAFLWAGRIEDRACRQLARHAVRQEALGQDVERCKRHIDGCRGADVRQGVKIEILGQPAIVRMARHELQPARAAALCERYLKACRRPLCRGDAGDHVVGDVGAL